MFPPDHEWLPAAAPSDSRSYQHSPDSGRCLRTSAAALERATGLHNNNNNGECFPQTASTLVAHTHAHTWDRSSAAFATSRFGQPQQNSAAMDAALVAVASSLLSMQPPPKDSPTGAWNNSSKFPDSPVYFSDTSTRAASLTRSSETNPVDALIAELVSKHPGPDFTLDNRSKQDTAACQSNYYDEGALNGFDWTPSPSTHILTLESGLSRSHLASYSMPRNSLTPYSRTRTLSHSSSPQLPGGADGLSLMTGCRVPAASYHGNRGAMPIGSISSVNGESSYAPGSAAARQRRASSGVSAQNELSTNQMDEHLSALREAKLDALLKSFNLTLDHKHNAVVHLPDCVKMILPVSAEGETLSIGSLLHYSGGCRNCIFNSGRQGCHNGLNCVFCHHSHPRPKRRSRRRAGTVSTKQQGSEHN